MYYDGTKLLSIKDINGNVPELYFVTSNRTAGKTTYFGRLLVNRFLKKKEKFMLIYRFANELDSIEQKFFNDIGTLFFKGHEMTSKSRGKGVYVELFLNGESCGYAIALNYAEKYKKLSHVFSSVTTAFMDEFQSENGTYLSNEFEKFLSVYTSVCRGQGEQRRYVQFILCGNPVSLINPYYTALGISDRIQKNTKFVRGNGWVLEQGFNESASKAQENSAILNTIHNRYSEYSKSGVYLNDTDCLIEKMSGGTYVCTIEIGGKEYGIRSFPTNGIIYCGGKADSSYPLKFTLDAEKVNDNYRLISMNNQIIYVMRRYFENGCFRFQNQACKKAIMELLSY